MSTITMQQQEDSPPLTHRHRSQRKGNDHVGTGTTNHVDQIQTTPTSAEYTSDKTETRPEKHPSKSSPSHSNTTTNNHNNHNHHNPTGQWWKRSLQAAFKGGASGSIAMVLQVILLMWLRTTINYQYKHGVDTRTALRQLYREGGLRRFYRGAWVALLTGPISRFGDTAAQEGIHEVWRTHQKNNNHKRRQLPVWAMTLSASLVAALWRVVITPLDTVKTTLQVTGSHEGWQLLRSKTRANGLGVLWDGALGNSMATLAGHYPWFLVHNFLDATLPHPRRPSEEAPPSTHAHTQYRKWVLLRRALLGFCSSVASDCLSNGIRVLKTYQQTSPVKLTLAQALADLLQANGPAFVLRGLRLKILANGLSGILFAVVWKLVLEELNARSTRRTRNGATTNTATADNAAAAATMAKVPSKEA